MPGASQALARLTGPLAEAPCWPSEAPMGLRANLALPAQALGGLIHREAPTVPSKGKLLSDNKASLCPHSFSQRRGSPRPQAVQPAACAARRHHPSENCGLWAGAQRGGSGGCRGSCRHPTLHGSRGCGGCPAGGWPRLQLHVRSPAGARRRLCFACTAALLQPQRRPACHAGCLPRHRRTALAGPVDMETSCDAS